MRKLARAGVVSLDTCAFFWEGSDASRFALGAGGGASEGVGGVRLHVILFFDVFSALVVAARSLWVVSRPAVWQGFLVVVGFVSGVASSNPACSAWHLGDMGCRGLRKGSGPEPLVLEPTASNSSRPRLATPRCSVPEASLAPACLEASRR